MSQLVVDIAQDGLVGANVDEDVREQLVELARRKDRSVDSIIRRALTRELERGSDNEAER